ncbi:MAG TPA: BTAD domain-containing putative transcriptional regulator [Ornithinibacter sp.]|nr:BTAD domain-containing putative transcriptional regulator [Ornithinibacter sp.]
MWGEDAGRLTTAAVHTVVARLRRRHGAGLVATSDAGYLVPADVGTDADRFLALAGAAHDGSASAHAEVCEQLCRQALALWDGHTAYEGVRAELVLAERTRLEELHRRVRADLAECLLRTDATRPDPEESLAVARGLLDENPLDEGAAALAMRAAYRLGRQAEALEVHEVLRRTLRDELGVFPGPAVSAVHAGVLAHDAGLGSAVGAVATASGRAVAVHPGRRLPMPASPTVGRSTEVDAVLAALHEGRRLVTVTGPGGVGKSRLLVDVGAALERMDGTADVVHVALSAHAGLTPAELAAGVAVTTGLPLEGDDEVAALVRALRSADLTVLVDEAEWALESAAEVAAAVLAGCPDVRLVVTSRTPLAVVGERVVVLEPLATADPEGDLETVRAAPAVRLLAERLADRGCAPTGDLAAWSEADVRVLGRVARRVDGLPLALELVAGSSATVPLGLLLDLVQSPLDLVPDARGLPDRHHSLRETLSWSLDRLDPDTRTVLRRVAVFAGPFTTTAARAVAGGEPAEVDRAVRVLARDNLLRVERTASTLSFRALRTVRDLALEELAEHGEVPLTRSRHRRWFAGVWRDAPLSDALVEHVGRTYDDHLEALAMALEVGDDPSAADLATTLSRRWQFVETPGPGLHWTTVVLALPGITARQRARLRVARGGFLQAADWGPAEHDRLAADLQGDPDWGTLLGLVSGITAYGEGDTAGARARLDEAERLARTGAAHLVAEVVATRAAVDAAEGRTEVALAAAHESLALVGSTSSAVQLVTVVPKVALALLECGRPREALDLLTTATADAGTRFGMRPTSTVAINTGWAALGVDDPEAALGWFRQAIVGPQAAAGPKALGEAACGAGAALAALGHPDAPEVLGLGVWLHTDAGQTLPPSLERHVRRATDAVGSTDPPAGWTPDLAVARVTQLVRAGSGT